MNFRLLRRRSFLTGIALLLGAAVVSRLVAGHATTNPLLFAHALPATPWSATLDQATGQLFIINRSLASADGTTYAFASAASYSFAVNGNIGSIYNHHQIQGVDSLSLLSADGASPVRTVPVGGDPGAAAVDPQHGLAYVTSEDDDTVSVLDARSAALLRTIRVGTRPNALAVSAPTGRLFVVNAGDGTVSVIDTGSARVLRSVAVPTAGDAASVAVDTRMGRVYVAAMGSLSILDARSGALLRAITLAPHGVTPVPAPAQTRPANLPVMTSTVVDERTNRVYILDAGMLTIVDAGRDRVLRRVSVGMNATALALDTLDGSLLLTHWGTIGNAGTIQGTGSVEVRDPRTGAILRSVSLGMAPIAVAVDARSGRVVVVDSGGPRSVSDPWGWLPSAIRQRLPFVPRKGGSTPVEHARILVLNLDDHIAPVWEHNR